MIKIMKGEKYITFTSAELGCVHYFTVDCIKPYFTPSVNSKRDTLKSKKKTNKGIILEYKC